MNLTSAWLEAIDGTNALHATIEFSRFGDRRTVDVADARRIAFEDADPMRRFVSWPGKKNFEGKLWMSTIRQHVTFESFWERSFLMMLDRTGETVGVASQPMRIRWRVPKTENRRDYLEHFPDYFARRRDGSALLVDVRPQELVKPDDQVKFDLTRRMASALGWSYLVFDDLPGATQENLRFLLRYRDPAWLEGLQMSAIPKGRSMPLAALANFLDVQARSGWGAAYALVWSGVAHVDLSRPLSPMTPVSIGGES